MAETIYYRSQMAAIHTDRRDPELNPGSPVVPLYRSQYNKDGVLELIEDGQHDLYAEIQSHAASTDMQLILDRYFNGDPSALSRVQGVYADITDMPTTIHEAMTIMDNARKDFETLPPVIKEQFGNDANQFLAQMGTDDWLAKMQLPVDKSYGTTDKSDGTTDKSDSEEDK